MVPILSWLYLGDRLDALNTFELSLNKISVVINLTISLKVEYSEQIEAVSYPLRDSPDEDISVDLDIVFLLLDLARLRRKKVLVHCMAGISRSATFVIYYLMRGLNMSLDDSFNYVKSRRNQIKPNRGFLKTLHQKDSLLSELNQ